MAGPDDNGIDLDALRDWVGRSEIVQDRVDPWLAAALHATLDRDGDAPAPGAPLPEGWHWALFRPAVQASGLGADGHPARGGFLPPAPGRRMWAGGRLRFLGPLPVGAEAVRRSTIADVTAKQGSKGPLVLVTVHHHVAVRGMPVLWEEHDIVYVTHRAAPRPWPDPGVDVAWSRTLTPDPVLLFRYSALTFNGHRIHYDADYAREAEGYPGLVVHGPLVATLLLDLVRRNVRDRPLTAFAYRAMSPQICGEALLLEGGVDPDDGDRLELIAFAPGRRVVMTATAQLGENGI